MPFRLPAFTVHVNLWRNGVPLGNPPSLTFTGNLRACSRPGVAFNPLTGGSFPMEILAPRNTDIRDSQCPSGVDTIEAPAGSGRFYFTYYVDDVAKGFGNEYRFAILFKRGTWPQPIP